jgi:hypothetical protein
MNKHRYNVLVMSAIAGATAGIACGHTGGHTQADSGLSPPGDGDGGGIAPLQDSGSPSASASDPPRSVSDHPSCTLSVDCPTGTHCDLGECIQSCSAGNPCKSSEICSPRGRCLGASAKDEDPPPVTVSAGTVLAGSNRVLLTERDETLRIHLVTTSPETVRYRVETDAPYLTVTTDRGEFKGETVLSLAVDPSGLTEDRTGSVRVYTTLGQVEIAAPIHAGLTARYHGVLTYDGTLAKARPLGTTRIDLSLSERHGDVLAAIDPKHSLLFPEGADGAPVSGYGSFTETDGVDLQMKEIVPADLGGVENPFRRAIGRNLRFRLKPVSGGGLDGTVEETVYGLFERPLTLEGHAHLERVPCTASETDCQPQVGQLTPPPAMPTVDPEAAPDISAVFPTWSASDCTGPGDSVGVLADAVFHAPFADRLSKNALSSTEPLSSIAEDCKAELLGGRAGPVKCAKLGGPACALGLIEAQKLGSSAHDVFATLFAHTLDPALFVAEDDLVTAVKESFRKGTAGEQKLLSEARGFLTPPMVWVLHPRILEYLRGIVPEPTADGVEPPSFAAGRTLSTLFYVLSTVDAEAARQGASDRLASPSDLRRAAQSRSLFTLFEAATLAGISESWPSAPPELDTALVDFLTPMDSGFASLEQGAVVFGVPEAFVPNVYDPERKGTNFEQVLDIASSRLEAFAKDEASFTSESREFEQAGDGLDAEIERVGAEYDSQIKTSCGDALDLDHPDFAKCGEGGRGTVGGKLLEIDQAAARVASAVGRAKAKQTQIGIEVRRVGEVKGIRDSTVTFTAQTGASLDANIEAQGVINVLEKFTEIAAHANILNGGAPLGEAVAMAGLESIRTGLEVDRQNIQTRQDMRVQEDNSAVEVVNGEAAIQSMIVDLSQIQLETREATLGVLQARADADNALAEARRAYAERTRALGRIGKSSLLDPTARVLLSRAAIHALKSRTEAQKSLYEAARALEYQLNRPMGDSPGKAALNVFSADEAGRMKACLESVFDSSRQTLPIAQDYVTEVSVRKLLGVREVRVDEVTGETLDLGAQLRRILLRNENIDGTGSVGIELSSNLDPGNQLWSGNVCDDRVTRVEAQLVGDFLGDNDAEVYLDLQGGGVLRRCDTSAGGTFGLMGWSTAGHAVIQAGVNTFGAASPNASLYGLSVASAKWKLVIPGATVAPSNADLDLSKIEDIVLRIHHAARPIPSNPQPVSFDCLADVGAVR